MNENKPVEEKKRTNTNKTLQVVAILLCIVVLGILIYGMLTAPKKLSNAEIETKMNAFVNAEMLEPGTTAIVKVLGKEGNLYKLEVDLGTQKVTSYASLDGTLFFPVGYAVNTTQTANTDNVTVTPPVLTEVPKTAKPEVELFVMSYCPYGIQAEKGMIPAIEALNDSVDFKLRFVYYAMHGKKEVDENIVQYCIQKHQPEKLLPYLICFNEAGDGAGCANKTQINMESLKSCYNLTDEAYGLNRAYENESTWLAGQYPLFGIDVESNVAYEIGGSPTLVINGVQVQSGRDPASYQAAICNAMTTPSTGCSLTLSSASPAPSFGSGTTTGTTTAQCY